MAKRKSNDEAEVVMDGDAAMVGASYGEEAGGEEVQAAPKKDRKPRSKPVIVGLVDRERPAPPPPPATILSSLPQLQAGGQPLRVEDTNKTAVGRAITTYAQQVAQSGDGTKPVFDYDVEEETPEEGGEPRKVFYIYRLS